MFLPNVGEIIPLVITPIWAFPTCAQSPWFACSLPINSKPTNFFWGDAFLLIKASLPTKSSSFVLRATAKLIPASKGSVWSSNSGSDQITVLRQYNFEGIYPNAVSSIPLDYGATDQIEEFQVTFNYLFWTTDLPGVAGGQESVTAGN